MIKINKVEIEALARKIKAKANETKQNEIDELKNNPEVIKIAEQDYLLIGKLSIPFKEEYIGKIEFDDILYLHAQSKSKINIKTQYEISDEIALVARKFKTIDEIEQNITGWK